MPPDSITLKQLRRLYELEDWIYKGTNADGHHIFASGTLVMVHPPIPDTDTFVVYFVLDDVRRRYREVADRLLNHIQQRRIGPPE